MRKILALLLILVVLTPYAGAQRGVSGGLIDRYTGKITILESFNSTVKERFDSDSSGYLDKAEINRMVMEEGIRLNLTPLPSGYFYLNNLTLDGRIPMFSGKDMYVNYTVPMPVEGISNYSTTIIFKFYLDGKSDHTLRLNLTGVEGHFFFEFPENDTVIGNNLINAKVGEHWIEGDFKDYIVIEFREMNYFWMNIFALGLLGIATGVFVVAAYKLRGGRTKGIKLLIRSILRNLVSLFAVLTFLFYILWVAGPPLSVRVGKIADIVMRYRIIQYYHLDRPWYDQYLHWWHLLLTGGITEGVTWGAPTFSLEKAMLVSLGIFVMSTLLSYIISVYLAVRKKSSRSLDVYAAMFLALYSVPTFYATYLILHTFERYPSIYMVLVEPVGGVQYFFQMLVAAVILSLLTLARPYLIARALAVREYTEPYVMTFRAIGAEPKKINRMVRRTTLIPTITDSVLNFGWILTAQVFLEVIFKIEGMGYILFRGTIDGNPFQIQIAIIYFAVVMIASSIISDVVIYFLDPRVRR